jgi:hypothetical protein
VREARFGRELWSWFVIAALLLLVAETIVARWGMPGRAPTGGALESAGAGGSRGA